MITCPICSQPHQEYWWVKPSGKRVLCYDCKRVQVMREIKGAGLAGQGIREAQYVTKRFEVVGAHTLKLGAIEERWSKKWAKLKQDEQQMSFPEGGRMVTRSHEADLTAIDTQIDSALEQKRLLQTEYEAVCQRQRTLEAELKSLGKKRSEIMTLKLI